MNVVEKEFDALASEYESNRLADWYRAHADEILRHCPDLKSGDILDVGCGSGYFLRSYMKERPGVRAVGIDLSAQMIEQAKQKAQAEGLDNIEFIQADWENLPPALFAEHSFKMIVCANAFHYFEQPQQSSDQFFRKLSDDGVLYVLERNKARSLLTFIWGIAHTVLIKDQVVFYKTAELQQFFKNAGFAGVSIRASIKRYLWKNKLFTSIVLLECKRKHSA